MIIIIMTMDVLIRRFSFGPAWKQQKRRERGEEKDYREK